MRMMRESLRSRLVLGFLVVSFNTRVSISTQPRLLIAPLPIPRDFGGLRSRQTGVLGSIFSKSEIKRFAVMSLFYAGSFSYCNTLQELCNGQLLLSP